MKNKVVDKIAVIQQDGVIPYNGKYYVASRGVIVKVCIRYIDAVLSDMSYNVMLKIEEDLMYGDNSDNE